MNHYETLKVTQSASHEEIRRSYHSLIRTAHPDKEGTCVDFNRIQEAWTILSDKSSREAYNVELKRKQLYQEFPISDELHLDELELEDEEYFSDCRCGGRYILPESEISSSDQILVTCDNCSLVIVVLAPKNSETILS